MKLNLGNCFTKKLAMKLFFTVHQLLCFSIAAILVSSCEIETLREKYEEKVLGTWEFKEVKKMKLFDNQNITGDYETTLLEFMPDGTLNILDKNSLSILVTGTWDMDDVDYSNDETTDAYVTLETKFDDAYNGVDYSFDEATINHFKKDELCFRENNFKNNKSVELKRN